MLRRTLLGMVAAVPSMLLAKVFPQALVAKDQSEEPQCNMVGPLRECPSIKCDCCYEPVPTSFEVVITSCYGDDDECELRYDIPIAEFVAAVDRGYLELSDFTPEITYNLVNDNYNEPFDGWSKEVKPSGY